MRRRRHVVSPPTIGNPLAETPLALSPNIRGSLVMATAMAAFTMNDAITKAVSAEINFGQVMLVRGLFAIALITALAFQRRALRPLRTVAIMPVALRLVGEIGGTVSFMAALTHLPLANTLAIFQALPLAITLGAVLVYREPVGWRRWLAIAAGFIGVLVIVRPGIAGFNEFSLFALVSVAFCAVRDLATRNIPEQIPSLFVTLLMTVTVTSAGAVILFPLGGWTPPSFHALGMLALAAILTLTGLQCMIVALRSGDISAVAPFRYSALLWAMLLGYLVFGDKPDVMMLTGAAIIVSSGLYAFYRERVRNRPVAATTAGIPPDGV
jgi:drug/metabolite transporter (DMT)-like permease